MLRRTMPLAVFTAVVLLAACGSPAPPSVDEEAPPQEPTQEAEAASPEESEPEAETVTLTDALGREVTIPPRVERIVTLAPSVTETLYAIGAGDQIVGRTDFDNYPPEVEGVQSVGGFSADRVNVEIVVGLEPDIVIGGSDLQQPLSEAFEAAGIPFFIFNPETLADAYAMFDLLGQMTGHEDGAQMVIEQIQSRIGLVEQTVADVPEADRPTVFYEVWDEPLLTAGPNTYIGEMIVIAGGVDIFSDIEEPYSQVSTETVIKRQPEFILGPDTHGEALTVEALSQRPGWGDIPAVRDGHVYLLDGDVVSRSGPRMVDAIEIMAAHLYPELFSE